MHLFAGGGGGLLADLILGHNPIIAVEWEKAACNVLRERASDGWFPNLQVLEGDIRMFNPSEYTGRVDCIHAGFPCQDISVAGKQAGAGEETRSGLYREVFRIADVVRPDYLFLENVAAILSNGMGTVLGDLSTRGYFARWICVRASDVGANHDRDRWWLLAKRRDISPHAEHIGDGRRKQQQGSAGEAQTISNCGSARIHERGRLEYAGADMPDVRGNECACVSGESQKETGNLGSQSTEQMADTRFFGRVAGRSNDRQHDGAITSSDGQHGGEIPNTSGKGLQGQRQISGGITTQQHDTGDNSERQAQSALGGMADGLASQLDAPTWWEIEPDIGRTTTDSTGRVAGLKMLGNGQVPLQAAVAFSMLFEILEGI